MDPLVSPEQTNLAGVTLEERYKLQELRGRGGMADVYLAWDMVRSANMAIKVLRPDIEENSLEYQLFEREADTLRKVEHPSIVRVYEFGRHNRFVFLVMDWVEGSDLRKAIADYKKPFPLEEVSRILNPVCRALNFAHQNQIYHCDIKPANILLHRDGRVLLSDFGVARLAAGKHSGGTPAYMAPEQILGRKVDARSDIYSLGITLYEMLSGGRPPFQGENESSQGSTKQERIQWEHCHLPAPPLHQFNPRLPNPVIEVVNKAIHKDADQRYASTLEMFEDFEQARVRNVDEESESNLLKTVYHSGIPAPLQPPKPTPPPVPTPKSAHKPVAQRPLITGPYLLGQAGQYTGQAIPLQQGRISIGRNISSQLRLRDGTVSRAHALIIRTRRAVYIQDEDSSLGTFVNGQRIYGPVALKHGDVIQIGYDQVFEFRVR